MYRIILVVIVALISGGCVGWGEWGQKTWCNDRFLYTRTDKVADTKHLEFAERGYMYALAGAYVLQKADAEGNDYYFALPSRLKPIPDPPRGEYGFDVKSFELLEESDSQTVKEVIVAFVGSNDWSDWWWTNFLFSKKQYELARNYVRSIHDRWPDRRIVVTGYSLGGALAVHVTKHPDTKNLIAETWAFNSSPKTWVPGDEDERIWHGAARGELLSSTRGMFFRWLPGINNLGAKEAHTAEDFYLIKTSGIYGHFRWVLARNMLHFADYKKAPNNMPPSTEPLEILKQSRFKICKDFQR